MVLRDFQFISNHFIHTLAGGGLAAAFFLRIPPFRTNLGAGAGLALIFSVAEEAAALFDFLNSSS